MAQYNPYHFVPVKGREAGQTKHDLPFAIQRDPNDKREIAGEFHERYAPDRHSGTIFCTLTTKTPILIGAAQARPNAGSVATVSPFAIDGKPAVPGSSLRGMVGSILEAASNSALRILDAQPFSFRKPMEKSLSALGEIKIVYEGERTRFELQPLALPMLEKQRVNNQFLYVVPPRFRNAFREPALKVFVGDRPTTKAIRRHTD